LVLVEAVERVVVELPTNVSVAVQLLVVGVGRFETVLVGVVHPLLSFLDELVQLLSDERREVEVLVLNPLVLVFPNGDCLPFHRSTRYARYTYNSYGRHGPVSLQQNSVWKTMTALYPRPTALLGLRPVLLVEDGA
jgi:hypothetical protein